MTTTTTKLEYRSFKYLDSSEIITSKYKSRLDGDDEEAFSNSIKENGIITPLIVSVSHDSHKYQIITGHRRLYHAQKQKIKDVPCIIWKNATNPDIALAQLIEVAHKQDYTDEQKAQSIAAVYESIGIKPQQAIKFVKQLHNGDYDQNKTGKAKSKTLNSITPKRDIEGSPTEEFLKLSEKIGYSPSRQFTYLQLITQLEPEILNFAEQKKLSMRTKTLLTHSQLKKALDEKSNVAEEKIAFKKSLVNKLVGKKESESRDIVHQAIGDLKDDVYDLKSGIVSPGRRKEVFNYNATKITEGRQGAAYAFSQGVEAIQKLTTILTSGQLKLERGESSLDEIPPERIKKVVKTHMIEVIKNLDDEELRSMNDKLSLLSKLIPEIVNLMDEEEDFRVQKKNMLST